MTDVRSALLRRRWPLGVVLLVAACLVPVFTSNDYVLRLFIQYGCIYAVVLAGLNVLIGASGQVSLGHVAFYAIGAYVSGWAGVAGMPWVLTAVLAIVAALAGGLAIGAPALRLRGAYLALATLAFALIVLELLGALPRVLGTGEAAVLGVPRPVIGPLVLDTYGEFYVFCVVLAAPLIAVSRNLFWSQAGRRLAAVRDDQDAASALGIAVFPARLAAFAFSAACAGLAGAMFSSFNENVFAGDFRTVESLQFVVALLIGGLAAPVAGPVVGALATVLLVYVGQTVFEADQALLTALVFLGILAFLPMGVGGLARSLAASRGLGWLYPGGSLVTRALERRGGAGADLSVLRPADAGADATAIVADLAVERELEHEHGAGPVLECVDLAKAYGGVRAVDGVSFSVRRSTIHVLMGPNGSGKSTVLNIVSGLVRADSGRVLLDGVDVTSNAPHERARAGLGRTFQEIRLFHSLTALENCLVGTPSKHRLVPQLLRSPGTRAEEDERTDGALSLLEAWGLGEFAARPASALSYGQRKMLELARAASLRPELLLVDEPSAGLNPRWVAAMVDALGALRDAGFTLLVVEHHQDVIADLSDMVTVLDQGKVIAEGEAATVQRLPEVMEVYLGAPTAAEPQR